MGRGLAVAERVFLALFTVEVGWGKICRAMLSAFHNQQGVWARGNANCRHGDRAGLCRAALCLATLNCFRQPHPAHKSTLQVCIKVIAYGLVAAPNTYLRDGWHMLDVIVVSLGWLEYVLGGNYSAIRSVRVLRPLRTITKIEKMRVGWMLGEVGAEGVGSGKSRDPG